MKKIFIFTFIISIFFVSCTVEDNDIYQGSRVYTSDYNVENWVQDGTYAYASINVSQITPNVMKNGAVVCYLRSNGYDIILPSIVTSVDEYGNIYTNTISCEVTRGRIDFISECSDLLIYVPGIIQIKVVVIENINY